MPTLPELRTLLVRQQAEVLRLEQAFRATPPGTDNWRSAERQLMQKGLAIEATKRAIREAQTGRQSSLL